MTDEVASVPSRTPDTERWTGTVFTFLSTFLFAISHVSVRYLTNYGEIDHNWMLFFKETVGLSILVPWLLLRWGQGRYRYTSFRLAFWIIIAAIFCQVVGARLQVLGFAVIGLIIAVPLIQSAMLLGIALLGRFVFGDSLSRRRKIAITILIVAAAILSIGKEMTAGQTPGNDAVRTEAVGTGIFLLIAIGTIVAGVAYAVYMTMLRYVIRQHWADNNSTWLSFKFRHWIGYDHVKQPGERFYSPFPLTLAMALVLGVGVVFFGLLLYNKSGVAGFYNVPGVAWYCVVISGICNLVGFFFQVHGLRMTSAVQVSLISVSQMLLLSLIGYMCFGEVIDKYGLVLLGLGLTVYGVFMSAKPEVPR